MIICRKGFNESFGGINRPMVAETPFGLILFVLFCLAHLAVES